MFFVHEKNLIDAKHLVNGNVLSYVSRMNTEHEIIKQQAWIDAYQAVLQHCTIGAAPRFMVTEAVTHRIVVLDRLRARKVRLRHGRGRCSTCGRATGHCIYWCVSLKARIAQHRAAAGK